MAATQAKKQKGTETRAALLEAIRALYEREGRPATQAELYAATKISLGSIAHHLPQLEADGDIIRKPGPRGIIPTRQNGHGS